MADAKKKSKLEQAIADITAGDDAPAASSLPSDPVARAAQFIQQSTPSWLPSPLPGVSLKEAERGLPQNAVQLATMLAMLPMGPAAARLGVPAAEYLASAGVLPGLARAALRGGVTAGAGALTGHDPLTSGAEGVAGSVVGETAAAQLQKLIKNAVSNRLFDATTKKLADVYRTTIGRWLPKAGNVSDAEVLRAVMGDEPARAVGSAIGDVKARLATEPIATGDLESSFERHGVAFAKPVGSGSTASPGFAAPSKLTPGREMVPFGAMQPPRRFGEVIGAIDQAEEAALEMLDAAPDHAQSLETLKGLKKLRDTVTARLPDSADKTELTDLYKAYGRTKTATDLWLGRRGATRAKGEQLLPLVESERAGGRAGGLSELGYQTLGARVGSNMPSLLGPYTPEEVALYRRAFDLPTEGGLRIGQLGQGPRIWPRIGAGVGLPHVTFHPEMPQPAAMPGWEAAQTLPQRLAPDAVRAILGNAPPRLVDAATAAPEKETP